MHEEKLQRQRNGISRLNRRGRFWRILSPMIWRRRINSRHHKEIQFWLLSISGAQTVPTQRKKLIVSIHFWQKISRCTPPFFFFHYVLTFVIISKKKKKVRYIVHDGTRCLSFTFRKRRVNIPRINHNYYHHHHHLEQLVPRSFNMVTSIVVHFITHFNSLKYVQNILLKKNVW